MFTIYPIFIYSSILSGLDIIFSPFNSLLITPEDKLIEIVWYLFEENKPKSEFKITDALLFTFPKDDLPIIKHDWECIIQKIKDGKAHEISEADTMYLGACTKGINSETVRKQPFSEILAKQRAFCLKTSYMTQLVRDYIGGEHPERLLTNIQPNQNFEEYLNDKLLQFKGKSVRELIRIFNLDSKAKNLNELILSKMLGIKGKISNTEEFIKANIVPKTIRIASNGKIKESMSFPTFKFEEIVNEEWETSNIYNMFYTTKFMFAIFVQKDNEYYFDRIKFWNMPVSTLNSDVHEVWSKTKDIIASGNIVKSVVNGKRETNFPGMSDNNVCHVRPHGQTANDVYPLPVPDNYTGLYEYTKQCFWLNSSYVLSIIKE